VNASNSCKHQLNVQSTTAIKDDIPIDLSKVSLVPFISLKILISSEFNCYIYGIVFFSHCQKGERLNDLKDPSYMLTGSTISQRWLSVDANAAVSAPYSNCFSEINPVFTTVGDCVEDKVLLS
jgi:hypothetical protein